MIESSVPSRKYKGHGKGIRICASDIEIQEKFGTGSGNYLKIINEYEMEWGEKKLKDGKYQVNGTRCLASGKKWKFTYLI